MQNRYIFFLAVLLIPALIALAVWITPDFSETAKAVPPKTDVLAGKQNSGYEKPCRNEHPEWRKAANIDGVQISESVLCEPDNPYDVAAFVKGMNNISMATLMRTRLSEDALTKSDDLDGDGDPDVIHIKLEVIELNGASPESELFIHTYDIAPGIQPGLWAFAPKLRGMSVKHFLSEKAIYALRAPSPVIRIEQGDKVSITLENTHYLPHTLHFHGVDHPWKTAAGVDNDGVPVTGDVAVFPGKSRTYELQPRKAGTMLYHCHVQTDKHLIMGLNGMFVVEENRPNNWVQTFNIGAGQVRHSSVAIKEQFDQEYDLHYQSIDNNLASIVQQSSDPRVIAKKMNREYNMTESSENYFLLNGHSFPYTLRDALIIAEPDQDIKLRMLNAQHSQVAIHIHGHKAKITHYDGVKSPAGLQLTRDVYDLSSGQRLDLHLQTINDGLHSYGPGIWIFHDHVETGVTNNGMSPGGNIAVLAYRDFVNDQGMPKVREEAITPLFTKAYYARQSPVWAMGDFTESLGEAGMVAPDTVRIISFGLLIGLSIGLLFFVVRRIRQDG